MKTQTNYTKRFTWIALSAGLCATLATAACGTQKHFNEVLVGAPTGVQLEGMGAELDPHFFAQNVTRNDGSKAEDWQHVVRRVKAMELKKFRVMALPQWYEPVNDNSDPHTTDISKFTFDSPEMQSLYKVLDLAQEQNMEVCIVVWGCPRSEERGVGKEVRCQ